MPGILVVNQQAALAGVTEDSISREPQCMVGLTPGQGPVCEHCERGENCYAVSAPAVLTSAMSRKSLGIKMRRPTRLEPAISPFAFFSILSERRAIGERQKTWTFISSFVAR